MLVLINIMMVVAIAVMMLTVSDWGRGGTARVSDCHRMDETQRLGEPCRRACGATRPGPATAQHAPNKVGDFPTGKAKIHSTE